MNYSNIEWTDLTWNPVTGCLHGCNYCYAKVFSERFGKNTGFTCASDYKTIVHEYDGKFIKMNGKTDIYPYKFEPTLHRYRLNEPIKRKKGKKIFVSSMGDLFGEWVPNEWIEYIFRTCRIAYQHQYIFLTKNPLKYIELIEKDIKLPSNAIYGASASTNTNYLNVNYALNYLSLMGHKTFLSLEPIQEEIRLTDAYTSVDWLIVGAETGRRKEKVIPKKQWISKIRIDCKRKGIPLFIKDNLKWREEVKQYSSFTTEAAATNEFIKANAVTF